LGTLHLSKKIKVLRRPVEIAAHSCRSRHRTTLQCSLRIADIHELRSISTVAMTAERDNLPFKSASGHLQSCHIL